MSNSDFPETAEEVLAWARVADANPIVANHLAKAVRIANACDGLILRGELSAEAEKTLRDAAYWPSENVLP